MSKAIVLSEEAWLKVYNQIAREYPPSVLLIRTRMKDVLGCTSRTHREYVFNTEYDYGQYRRSIHLDFYDEKKRTMFLLKYSDFLNKETIG